MSEAVFTSPLAHRTAADLSVGLTEIFDRAAIDLRGHTSDPKFMATAKASLGFALPMEPRTSASKNTVTALWMSTDQWLITLPRGSETQMLSKLRTKLGKTFSFACDVSDARAIIRLTGNGSREVMMKGSSVEFHAPDVVPGWVRRVLFADIAAACHMVSDDPECFDLYVFRSYADYVWAWLEKSARRGAEVELFQAQEPPQV